MTREQIVIGAVAAAVALWPQVQAVAVRVLSMVKRPSPLVPIAPVLPQPAEAVGFESAVHNLALVRSRLLSTAMLAEEQRKAIDVLTLALVAGSDK